MYITLGFKWLFQAFCPASAFATAGRDEAGNPQSFIHATVVSHAKKSYTDSFGWIVKSCKKDLVLPLFFSSWT
jgi:hypothetical protein